MDCDPDRASLQLDDRLKILTGSLDMFGKNLTARWSRQPHPESKQNLKRHYLLREYLCLLYRVLKEKWSFMAWLSNSYDEQISCSVCNY